MNDNEFHENCEGYLGAASSRAGGARELPNLLRQAATVLDEPFHHDAIAVTLQEAADELERLSGGAREPVNLDGLRNRVSCYLPNTGESLGKRLVCDLVEAMEWLDLRRRQLETANSEIAEALEEQADAARPRSAPMEALSTLTEQEAEWVCHAAGLRSLTVDEYVIRAINAQLRREGVDAVLLRQSDDGRQ